MKDVINNIKEKAQEVMPDKDTVVEKTHRAGEAVKAAAEEVRSRASDTKESIEDRINRLDVELETAIDAYNAAYTMMNDNGMSLYLQRIRSIDLIENVEHLINSIANHPKSFDKDLGEIRVHKEGFTHACEFAREELKAAEQSAGGAGAGIAAGAGVACLAPTAAMWIATTFGTASTGAAISTLSGAATTNAALAWLGGGALAAGGNGIAGGSALLAMAGPVGWGIAGATILTSILLFASKKGKLNKKKNEEIIKVKENTEAVKEAGARVGAIASQTISLRNELNEMYQKSLSMFDCDFLSLSEEQQMSFGTLVNNTKSLSALLETNI